jgi:hypothetical protein
VTAFSLLALQAAPSAFERTVSVLADVATIIIAVAIIVVASVAIYGALKARRAIARARTDLHPAIQSLTVVAANAESLSRAVRDDAEAVRATLHATNEKVQRATAAAEHRLGELNVLLGVVQREAENAFISTAAAVRGVQAGAGALRGLPQGEPDPGTELRVTPPSGHTAPE